MLLSPGLIIRVAFVTELTADHVGGFVFEPKVQHVVPWFLATGMLLSCGTLFVSTCAMVTLFEDRALGRASVDLSGLKTLTWIIGCLFGLPLLSRTTSRALLLLLPLKFRLGHLDATHQSKPPLTFSLFFFLSQHLKMIRFLRFLVCLLVGKNLNSLILI